jgi:molybdenum cofactor biosynthesis enzyme MoaA
MATATYQEIYNAAMDAILAITQKGASEVTVNGTTYKRHDLGRLQQLADWAKAKIAAGTRRTAVVTFQQETG